MNPEKFVKLVPELEHYVCTTLIDRCKLDACIFPFLKVIRDIRGHDFFESSDNVLDFRDLSGENAKQIERAIAELRKNITRLRPALVADESKILQNEAFRKILHDSRGAMSDQYTDKPFAYEVNPTAFQERLIESIVGMQPRMEQDPTNDEQGATQARSLSSTAFDKVCQELGKGIAGERATASFACGGLIPIKDGKPAQQSEAKQEYLMSSTVQICFHPADFGILESVEQVLLPRFNSDVQNLLPFRRLTAELYKLNVYVGPSGLFQKHVDTPRAENQIGSLVVCLPAPFEGGNLVVRHHGKEVDFDWTPDSGWAIQWAAFYSDCEHEIKAITQGNRVTLTYNLYVTEHMCRSSPEKSIVSPRSLPIYSDFKDLLREPGLMKYAGHAKFLLPSGLKGADLAVYSALFELGVEAKVLPVLKQGAGPDPSRVTPGEDDYPVEDDYSGEDEGEPYDVYPEYLKKGTEFPVDYEQYPYRIPIDSNVDRYWKMLYLAPHPLGIELLVDMHTESVMGEPVDKLTRGGFIGAHLNPYATCDPGGGGECPVTQTLNSTWHGLYHPNITWIVEPAHREMAFTYLAYGNESSIETLYSCAAIIAIIPPFSERGSIFEASK
ncbi:hypothetical protein N7492_005735 [Penicillium capsulatum]|uniref:Fe2OG dioxygenase domain-containing protein n=1 Tax=Penicillium capsulatum TaxID=69766 RepID=A0A9W9LRE7_9EURO|nr:hypothetical protein N7492_005735 [Penicillium capsulatum]KAJ6135167.1 hypothetical protein N7512_000327 [Penicillium capsulatum]